jgi:hypothetical protein
MSQNDMKTYLDWVKMSWLSMSLIALTLATDPIRAAERDDSTIRLNCTYSYSIDSKGDHSGTSGEKIFTVERLKDGLVNIHQEGPDGPYSGTIVPNEISGELTYKLGGRVISQSIVINRYNGQFKETFHVENSKGGLIHFGNCRVVTKPLF